MQRAFAMVRGALRGATGRGGVEAAGAGSLKRRRPGEDDDAYWRRRLEESITALKGDGKMPVAESTLKLASTLQQQEKQQPQKKQQVIKNKKKSARERLEEEAKLLEDTPSAELHLLANAYFEGAEGVEQDKDRAVRLWALAAGKAGELDLTAGPEGPRQVVSALTGTSGKRKEKMAASLYSLASCLRSGEGVAVPQPEKAATFYRELAQGGDGPAAYNLAVMLTAGELSGSGSKKGGREEEEEALKWYLQAANKGVPGAWNNAANLVARSGEDDAKARDLYEKGAQVGDPRAIFTLATWQCNGRGGEEDWEMGFQNHKRVAEYGMPEAMFNLANHYFAGKGVEESPEKAVEWFEKAAEKNFVQAQLNLGKLYMEGMGVPQDNALALSWLTKAAHGSVAAGEASEKEVETSIKELIAELQQQKKAEAQAKALARQAQAQAQMQARQEASQTSKAQQQGQGGKAQAGGRRKQSKGRR